MGFPLGLQDVLQGDIPPRVLEINCSNFLEVHNTLKTQSWQWKHTNAPRTEIQSNYKEILTVILPLISDLMTENTFDPRQSERETDI